MFLKDEIRERDQQLKNKWLIRFQIWMIYFKIFAKTLWTLNLNKNS